MASDDAGLLSDKELAKAVGYERLGSDPFLVDADDLRAVEAAVRAKVEGLCARQLADVMRRHADDVAILRAERDAALSEHRMMKAALELQNENYARCKERCDAALARVRELEAVPNRDDGHDSGSLAVRIEGGDIVIRLGVDCLPIAVGCAPWNISEDGETPSYLVTDPAVFARELIHALKNETEDGTTFVFEMFDKAFEYVVEHGYEGIDENPAASPEPAKGGDQ